MRYTIPKCLDHGVDMVADDVGFWFCRVCYDEGKCCRHPEGLGWPRRAITDPGNKGHAFVTIDHACLECGFRGAARVFRGKVECPTCEVINDVWLDGDAPPPHHRNPESTQNHP